MTTLTIANQKGGTGKTMIVSNLAGALAAEGDRVLVVDLDSQAQAATALGAHGLLTYAPSGQVISPTIADLLAPARGSQVTLADAVIHTQWPGLDLLPASSDLEDARRTLETNPAAGLRALARVLSEESLDAAGLAYDWVLIDTAPKLDILLDNALVASDYALAVLAPEAQQVEPLMRFVGRLEGVRDNMHPDLALLGVLFNKANFSWVSTDRIPAMLAQYGMPALDTIIPMYSRIAASYAIGPIALTAPNSREAGVIRTAAAEIVARSLAHRKVRR